MSLFIILWCRGVCRLEHWGGNVKSRGKLINLMTHGTKPQADHDAASKALAELDSPRRLIYICGNVDMHYSLNLCQ